MKKVISILLLVVSMVMLMAGCYSAPNEAVSSEPSADVTVEPVNFKFTHMSEPRGEYNKPGFGDKYGIFRFEGTNVVVFNINVLHGGGYYLLGEDTGENGPSWGDVPMYEGHFLALSNKYMLFLTKDGIIAKDLLEREEERSNGTFLVHDAIPFEELPVEEQEAFVYPCSYEVVENTN